HQSSNEISMRRVQSWIKIQTRFAEKSVRRVVDVCRTVATQTNPIVHVVPARGLDVELAVTSWKSTAICAASGRRRPVVLRVTAETAEVRDIHSVAVKVDPGTTVRTFVHRAGNSGEITAAGVDREELHVGCRV